MEPTRRTCWPTSPLPLILPLLLLLADIGIDYGLCQRQPRSIVQDPSSSCQLTPLEWNTTVTVGTNISVACDRRCTELAVEENQRSRKVRTVKGRDIYSLDSDLCLAAIHDARVLYPSHWEEDTANVQLIAVPHQGQFLPSFRRGIATPRERTTPKTDRIGLEFTSRKANEPVPEITAVYKKFRYSEQVGNSRKASTEVECHVPVGLNLSEVKLFRLTGTEYSASDTSAHENEDRGNYKEVEITPGAKALCSLQRMLYSDTTVFGYIVTPDYEPDRLVYRASLGERIEVRLPAGGELEQLSWLRDSVMTDVFKKLGDNGSYIIRSAKADDSGLYELRRSGRNRDASALSVIVRGCPANHYGPECRLRCPYCLHGGQCHDVTGQCVCPPGFTGDRCQTSCPRGRFGASCSSVCPGDDGVCEDHLLCVPEPYGCGCASGFTGTSCNTVCTKGFYGPDCTSSCGRCREGRRSCDRFTGECEGDCEDGFDLPLCLDLAPWFRDPPELVRVGFTDLIITHAPWRNGYDNGYGTGSYRYTIEYMRNDSGADWSPGDTVNRPQSNGNVTLSLGGLRAETTYWARIVIGDERRRTSTRDDSKVPAISVTTNCQEPLEITEVTVTDISSRSALLVIGRLRNENEACAYSLHWTLIRTPSDRKTDEVTPAEDGSTTVPLRDLLPYNRYTVQVVASNRLGLSGQASQSFRTDEAAPTEVVNLTVTKRPKSGLNYVIYWAEPKNPNGRIRHYNVILRHHQYLACKNRLRGNFEEYRNVTAELGLEISVRHPYSEYSVAVTAVTVFPGPAATKLFTTERQAPSAGLSETRASLVYAASVELSSQLPECTRWNDDLNNIRITVHAKGTSPWNKNRTYNEIKRIPLTEQNVRLRVLQLTPYSNYTALMTMNNSIGFSPDPQRIAFATRQSREGPGRPSNLTVLTVSSTSLTIGWNPPSPPLCRVTEYRMTCSGPRCSERGTVTISERDSCRADSPLGRRCSAVVDDLEEVTFYTILVRGHCSDVRSTGQESRVTRKTEEGKPGPPTNVRQEGFELRAINISWSSPVQRNGVILWYQLNVTEDGADRPAQTFVIGTSPDDPLEVRYQQLVAGLEPGQSYRVHVAASTSAGQGNISTVMLETQVPPPQLQSEPEVRTDLITDTTVQLKLPSAASPDGPPITSYFVIVSDDQDFDGGELEEYEGDLPNVEEASKRGISFYVAAVADPEHVDQNGTFVIGDGRYFNTSDKSYYNRPLKTGTTYRIGMAALAKLSEKNQGLSYIIIKDPITVQAPTEVGMILGILFTVVLLSLFVIALVVYRKRLMPRKANTNGQQETNATPDHLPLEPTTSNPPIDDDYANLTSLFLNKTRIQLPDLPAAARDADQLRSQIDSLKSGLVRPFTYARLVQNRAKNRYGNLMPYDDSRVKLEKLPDDEFSDYINASYVDGYERSGAYIATQGPKTETIFDFWRMLWEKKAVRIVMLTNLVEGDKKKCDLYWPEDKPLQLLGLTVHKESERVSNDYTIRTFAMARGGERRTVTQLHYTAWPDHSVPLYPSSLARFIRELDAVPDGDGPTVVHCSAGVGRTGTVILIDAMHKMGRREQAVDVYRQLTIIREQRANLCANQSQYQLVHQVLVELLVSPSTAIPAAQLAVRLPQLKSVAEGPSQLEQQLSYLASNPPPASFASALAEQLEGKNRSPEILPEDKSRVFLHGSMRDNYVNAVYVQGFKKPDAFIATEAPLPARRGIFWQMIIQKQSQTIVVMKDLTPEDVFWPTTEEPVIFGSIAAQLKNKITEPVETLDVTLNVFTNGQMESSQEVRLFLLPFGPAADSLPSPGDLVSLHAAYERSMPHNFGGVTTVVCRTGVTGCGLFIACSFIMDQLAEEQEIDVVMAVSTVRKSRPQFIGTLKQFELCYDVALAWLKAFDIYSNFQ